MYIDALPKDALIITGYLDYVDPRGNIYGIETRNNKNKGKFFIKTQNTVHGYKYCGITQEDGKKISKRVHRLVAMMFIPNPNNYEVVIHLDNNKSNNNVSNLKWGTVSENTQQAVDDGLLVNAKGFEDSQSIACECYDTLTNKHLGTFGSVKEAAKATGVTPGGILFNLKNELTDFRKSMYFTKLGEAAKSHYIIVQYDKTSDAEIGRFYNIGNASKITGIAGQTISAQVNSNKKPKWGKQDCYFLKQLI